MSSDMVTQRWDVNCAWGKVAAGEPDPCFVRRGQAYGYLHSTLAVDVCGVLQGGCQRA